MKRDVCSMFFFFVVVVVFSSPEPKAHKVSLLYTNGPSSVRRRPSASVGVRRRPSSSVVHTFKLEYL